MGISFLNADLRRLDADLRRLDADLRRHFIFLPGYLPDVLPRWLPDTSGLNPCSLSGLNAGEFSDISDLNPGIASGTNPGKFLLSA